jgi:glycerol-3-phosphate dehydrogenase (NAD(P)+)
VEKKMTMSKNNLPAIGMIGGGSWATALAKMLTENGHTLHWWMRDAEIISSLKEKGVNSRYLRMVHFDTSLIHPTDNLNEVVEASELLIVAIPAAFVATSLSTLDRNLAQKKTWVSATKGLEPTSHQTITAWLGSTFSLDAAQLAAVSGPCHAEEVAQDLTAYLTIGATNEVLGKAVAQAIHRPYVRTSVLTDVSGIEYAAVMKNIYAVAAGMATALNEGDNFRSVLIAGAAREMEQFLSVVCPAERDICHSVYLGDLLVTAYSQHSRNRTFGSMIGHGYTVRSAQLEMNMVAEGYYASKSVWNLCKKKGIELPIADAVYRIIYELAAPKVEFELLKGKLY